MSINEQVTVQSVFSGASTGRRLRAHRGQSVDNESPFMGSPIDVKVAPAKPPKRVSPPKEKKITPVKVGGAPIATVYNEVPESKVA